MGPAAAHFWSRLQMAARTMLAAGGAALVGLGFWAWAGQVTWFSAVLCIISMRATLVRGGQWIGVC